MIVETLDGDAAIAIASRKSSRCLPCNVNASAQASARSNQGLRFPLMIEEMEAGVILTCRANSDCDQPRVVRCA